MKYIKTFESHRKEEKVNEDLVSALSKLVGNLFKKTKEFINKTKGGKEVEAIYQKYLKLINDQFANKANIDLNIESGDLAKPGSVAEPVLNGEGISNTHPIGLKVNEADDTDSKVKVSKLKEKKAVLDQIVKKMKEMALKEMTTILQKYGGAAKNPQLAVIVDTRNDQFDLDYLNTQIAYLEKAGDTTQVAAIKKQRDAVAKGIIDKINAEKDKKPIEYKEGDEVIYLRDGKKKEDWNKLSDEEKKKPTEGNATGIVALNKISKIDGDEVLITGENGQDINKTMADLVGKKASEYKAGDDVVYKRKKFEDADMKTWSTLTDDEKKNIDSEKFKALSTAEKIGRVKIESVEGDKWKFKGEKDTIEKNISDILLKIEPK